MNSTPYIYQLRDAPEDWQPVFSVAEVEGGELADAEGWCIGFLRAVALDAQAWGPFFERPELAGALRPIVLLGADESELDAEDAARLDDPAVRDGVSRAVIDAVLLLNGARPSGG